MNAEAKRLLDAILAEPDRDEPRLVYADWLLASGDRLGELIVAQIEHARDPDNPELGRRADALISALRAEVIGDLPLSEPVFRRGFVEAAQLDARAFVELGVRLFDRLPLLTGLVVWFEGLSANREVCKSPVIRRLRELGLRYADGAAQSVAEGLHAASAWVRSSARATAAARA